MAFQKGWNFVKDNKLLYFCWNNNNIPGGLNFVDQFISGFEDTTKICKKLILYISGQTNNPDFLVR